MTNAHDISCHCCMTETAQAIMIKKYSLVIKYPVVRQKSFFINQNKFPHKGDFS